MSVQEFIYKVCTILHAIFISLIPLLHVKNIPHPQPIINIVINVVK